MDSKVYTYYVNFVDCQTVFHYVCYLEYYIKDLIIVSINGSKRYYINCQINQNRFENIVLKRILPDICT